MRVLHVLHHSFPQLHDGYAVRSHALLRELRALGYSVTAVTTSANGVDRSTEDVVDSIRYLRTMRQVVTKRPGLREWWLYRHLVRSLGKVANLERPNLVHAHSPVYNGIAAWRIARSLRIPFVYEIRATWEDAAVDRKKIGVRSPMYALARNLETFLCSRANAIVTICAGLGDEIVSRGIRRSKVFVVPNAVDSSAFQPNVKDAGALDGLGHSEGPVFGFIGSLFHYEGVEDLLTAVPGVIARIPSAKFLIIGGGERSDQIRRQAEPWIRKGTVIYHERVPFSDVARYYSVMDCAVYPRLSVRLTELVTPIKPLEAMAAGKLVVASDIGGHRELIKHGQNGLLFPPGDVVALTEMLCSVALSPALTRERATAGRNYVLAERTWPLSALNCVRAYDYAFRSFPRN